MSLNHSTIISDGFLPIHVGLMTTLLQKILFVNGRMIDNNNSKYVGKAQT
jgi:hypothetical protein